MPHPNVNFEESESANPMTDPMAELTPSVSIVPNKNGTAPTILGQGAPSSMN